MVKNLYETNDNFKKYVDHYCNNYNEGRKITTEEAFTHAIVKDVAKYYKEKEGKGNDLPNKDIFKESIQ